MSPAWLTALAWIAIVTAFLSAGAVVIGMGVGHRPRMPVMGLVWPISGLYLGPVAVWGYWRYGRPASRRRAAHRSQVESAEKPEWAAVAVAVSHCGAGCTLGDILAEFAIFGLGLEVAGSTLGAEYAGDYLLAVVLGVIFQFFAITPSRGLGVRRGLYAAAKADIVSLTAFEVGLFGWMAIMNLVLFPAPHHLRPDSPVYWMLMQVGMIIGFATAWPADLWLIRRGIKEAM